MENLATPGNALFIAGYGFRLVYKPRKPGEFLSWVVAKWVSAGLLTPAVTLERAVYFDKNEVDRFIADHVFTDQADEILGVGVSIVAKWAWSSRLHPVAGTEEDGCHRYLLRRAEVKRLRPKNRLTGPQMARVMGIRCRRLYKWVREGRLQLISGPEIDGRKSYLFLRDEVRIFPGIIAKC